MTGAAVPVVGVDGCAGRWAAAIWHPGTAGTAPVLHLLDDAAAVLNLARSVGAAVVALDLPMGLAGGGERAADRAARRELPGGASRVFMTPSRPVVLRAADGYLAARTLAAERGEAKPSAQAFSLLGHVRAWDDVAAQVAAGAVPGTPAGTLVEAHPEVSFVALAGRVLAPKRSARGVGERVAALGGRTGLACSADAVAGALAQAPAGTGVDDALDAMALAWTAARVAAGSARRLPDPAPTDVRGIPMALRV